MKYDYHIDTRSSRKWTENSSPASAINKTRVVSKDHVLIGTGIGELKVVNLLTGSRHLFIQDDIFFPF